MEKAIIVGCSVFAAAIIVSVAAFAAAKNDGIVTTKAIECIARQPEAKQSILVTMLISVGLIELVLLGFLLGKSGSSTEATPAARAGA